MAPNCCAPDGVARDEQHQLDTRYRRVLVTALAINAVMFGVEMVAGLSAGSVSLQADSLDFFGDAANYGISLFVLGMALRYRAAAAFVKGATMGLFGIWVLGAAVWYAALGTLPHAATMGAVGFSAFVANLVVFGMLWAYRRGDSNMRSVWLCSRNDVAGNLAVLLAAAGVLGTGTGWPDIVVAGVMAALALQGAWQVITLALAELRSAQHPERRDALQGENG